MIMDCVVSDYFCLPVHYFRCRCCWHKLYSVFAFFVNSRIFLTLLCIIIMIKFDSVFVLFSFAGYELFSWYGSDNNAMHSRLSYCCIMNCSRSHVNCLAIRQHLLLLLLVPQPGMQSASCGGICHDIFIVCVCVCVCACACVCLNIGALF
jgi:hypothetical protein